ncbi:hypothetical protein [Actibacterium sp. 188UL27-1]|uniref:hypothetical protein n=1 Tax=Actibacterium sp. 188UL27-1 TaxID=2786961 RepID=UPI00195A842F|nr:hypothetical protein [Actibacterium sp. 188UL27-1]MBM7066162.1 hypothetical protein [Actibacterium sp. 188UL27-1]
MFSQKTSTKAALIAAVAAISTQAGAHGVVTEAVQLPVIGVKDTHTVTVTCPGRHYAIAGGFHAGERVYPDGPIMVTASYPKNTRSWTVEFTNRSGRPTASTEANASVYVMCEHHR